MNNSVKIDSKLAKQLFEEAPPKPDGLKITYVRDVGRNAIELHVSVVDKKGNDLVHITTNELRLGDTLTIGEMYKQVPLLKLST